MAKSNQGLSQHQQQQLRLNMRQMLLGRLLEMSAPEFEEEIVRAMEENPALTTLDAAEGDRDDEPRREVDDEADDYDEDDLPYADTQRKAYTFSPPAGTTSDAEIIEQQLSELHLSEMERETAHYIIGNLDASGYLTRSAAAIADDMALTAGVDVPVQTVEKMIRTVKSLDPAGIGAENLRECLAIQLQRMEPTGVVKAARDIIERHYKQFVNNHLEAMREVMGIGQADFDAAVKLIRSLNPKPGAGLFDHSDERTRHITPDFIIDVDDNGRLIATLAGQVPDLVIDPLFRLDSERITESKAAEFIKERHDGAEEFIDAVKRRGSTLMAIMKAIISLQPEFFKSFELHDLRPMVIRDIEERTGLDKSVISRATSSKYMLTPDGIYPLKVLFGESASSTSDIGPREVEETLRKLIDHEDKRHPLSDDDLTAALNAAGMAVARRTVAKYRERIGIPVARLRKRF